MPKLKYYIVDKLNYLSSHKYVRILLIFICVYSLFTIFSPFNNMSGDFINDYSIIKSIFDKDIPFIRMFKTESFYGQFLSNLLIALNYKLFNYSLNFINFLNYFLNILIIVLTFTFINPKKTDKKNYFAFIVFFVIIIDFFNTFQNASFNNIKIMIVVNLLSFILFKKALDSNSSKKSIFIVLSIFLEIFAFFIPSIIAYLYFSIKKREKILNYFSTVLAYMIVLGINYNVFLNYTSYNIVDKFIYVFSSPLAPISRLQDTEYIVIIYQLIAIITCVYIFFALTSAIINKNWNCILSSILLLINLVISLFYYTDGNYTYSSLHIINRYLFAYSLYSLILYSNCDRICKYINISFEKTAAFTSLFAIAFSTIFGVSYICINNNDFIDYEYVLSYATKYDSGILTDGVNSHLFEEKEEEIIKKYKFFLENNLIVNKENIVLEKNNELCTKDTIRYIRGSRVDTTGERWLKSNFSFECYVVEKIINIKIYSEIDNNLVLYVNNENVGNEFIIRGENVLSYYVGNYVDENVIVHGIFNNEYKGPLDDEDYWSCEIMSLFFESEEYGFQKIESNGTQWTKPNFGKIIKNIEESYIFTLYLPDFEGRNKVDIYYNSELISSYELVGGYNEIYIDFSNYIGKDIFLRFSIEKCVISNGLDERILGAIVSKVEKKNIGFTNVKAGV